jgi:hypothetical protein
VSIEGLHAEGLLVWECSPAIDLFVQIGVDFLVHLYVKGRFCQLIALIFCLLLLFRTSNDSQMDAVVRDLAAAWLSGTPLFKALHADGFAQDLGAQWRGFAFQGIHKIEQSETALLESLGLDWHPNEDCHLANLKTMIAKQKAVIVGLEREFSTTKAGADDCSEGLIFPHVESVIPDVVSIACCKDWFNVVHSPVIAEIYNEL